MSSISYATKNNTPKQEQFSGNLLPPLVAILTEMIIPRTPLSSELIISVFAANTQETSIDDTLNGIDEADITNGFDTSDQI